MGKNQINEDLVKLYFEDNASQWSRDGYKNYDYNYPVGFHRRRIVKKIISDKFNNPILVTDLGCGAGDVSIALAKNGHRVIGVDQSSNMISLCKKNAVRDCLETEINNLRFVRSDVLNYSSEEKSDVVIAMGLIGYINNENELFQTARELLKPGGIFIISCRNKLFNFFNGSKYFSDEFLNKDNKSLVRELCDIESSIPSNSVLDFLKELSIASSDINKIFTTKKEIDISINETNKDENYDFSFSCDDNKQHSPKELDNIAESENFERLSSFGIHPHILPANLNKHLPPGVFNKLSDSLCVLESLPISLKWSSVFISVYKISED